MTTPTPRTDAAIKFVREQLHNDDCPDDHAAYAVAYLGGELTKMERELAAAQEARRRAEKERDDALKAVDDNWVTHQRVVAAEERAEEYRNELDRFKEEREGNTRQFRRLQERLAQAEADAFSMSAGQCIVTNGGLMGDDHGHLYCDMQRQRDEARRAAERIWAAAVEVIDAERKWSYSQPTIQALRELEAAIAEGK